MKLPRILINIETSSAYGRNLVRGFGRFSRIHQPLVLISPPRIYHGADIAREFTRHISSMQIDAVVTRDFEDLILDALEKLDIPKIYVTHIHPQLQPSIQVRDDQVGRLAAEHFIERGFTRFGYCGLEPYYWSEQRKRSFAEAVAEYGHTVDCFERPGSAEERSTDMEILFISKWLESLPKPVAVLACTDDRAQMIVQAAELCNLRIPEQIAVVGVDNDEFICDTTHIPLSSVCLDGVKAGFAAAKLSLDMIDQGTAAKDIIYIPATRVEVRQSSDILAVEDPILARALGYINERVDEKITPDDVARYAGVSKTVLNYRFKKMLSRSIFDQISAVRIRRMCWMLENTDISMLDIALAMGMGDDKHLYRYFKRYTGTTPLKWRRKMREGE